MAKAMVRFSGVMKVPLGAGCGETSFWETVLGESLGRVKGGSAAGNIEVVNPFLRIRRKRAFADDQRIQESY
jgi:hypothetical protein